MRATSTIIITSLAIVVLVVAKNLLIPFVLAVFLWLLIRSLAQAFQSCPWVAGACRRGRPAT